jgi:hypothetical protein
MKTCNLWGVYTSFGNLEQWTRETGDRMEALVDNEGEYDLSVEYFDDSDPRVALYGWRNFPMFVAVEEGQPFQKRIGKLTWDKYEEWIRGLGWKR